MKNTCFRINLVKISSLKLIISLALLSLVGLSACNSDDIGGNLYTFTDETMGEYLRKHPDSYSEFTRLLDTTHVMSLLNTYGTYTCFAPDNKAMRAFYKLKGKSDLSDFSLDSLKQIAYDHIIMGTAVNSTSFVEGRLPELSMSDRYITVTMKNTGEIFINKTSQIIVKDIIVHNGIIHQIDEALNPVRDGVVEAISKDAHFNLFYQALEATGLADSLMLVQDDSYNAENYKDLATTTLDQNNWFYEVVPQKRKFGYTVLMESDSTMNASQGITDMESLKVYAASVYDKVYPEDANITNPKDRRNSLNRFIAYHLITKQLGYSTFIDAYDVAQMVKTRDMYEYVETMCPNTLIEVSKIRSLNETNLLNRDPETGAAVRIVKSNSDNDAINGVYHEVDKMLVYDQATHNMMSTKRLRFDSASFFDELTNNNMRDKGVTDPNLRFALPRGYVNRISCTEQTVVQYLTGYPKYEDYEGDEIFLRATSGKLYDFTIETLPVPAGTYEVRFGYGANGNRGVAQLYFDGTPCSVPLNLSNLGTSVAIGYVEPHTDQTDYDGFENDKMMRNRGYMKAPAVFRVPVTGWFYGENARFTPNLLRRILGIYTFKKAGRHVLGVKGLCSGEFMFDYMEFVPTSSLESEDIY